jgi:hypothetical protein
MEIRYGWNGFVFDLRRVRINTHIELQEQDEAGTWDYRQVPGFGEPDNEAA